MRRRKKLLLRHSVNKKTSSVSYFVARITYCLRFNYVNIYAFCRVLILFSFYYKHEEYPGTKHFKHNKQWEVKASNLFSPSSLFSFSLKTKHNNGIFKDLALEQLSSCYFWTCLTFFFHKVGVTNPFKPNRHYA